MSCIVCQMGDPSYLGLLWCSKYQNLGTRNLQGKNILTDGGILETNLCCDFCVSL